MRKPSKEEKQLGLKLIFGVQYLIDTIDDLKQTTYHRKDVKTKAINLSNDLITYYGSDLKKLFNWNSDLVCLINTNYDKFWNHIINMNPSELNELSKILDKAKVEKP